MASSKTSILLLVVAIASTISSPITAAEVEHGPLLGGWQPIQNLNDPKIQDLAKFALTEHNKLAGANMQFDRVLKGEQQVVAGMNYRLILEATSDGRHRKYEAIVWVRPWENIRKLTSFRSV